MAFTTPSTWTAGDVLTAAQLNEQVRDNLKFLHGPPSAKVRRAASQSLSNNAWTPLQFDTEDWDSNSIWSSTSNTKLFCRTAGKYLATFYGGFAGSSVGSFRAVAIQFNSTVAGSAFESAQTFASTALTNSDYSQNCTALINMTTGQYVRAQMFQNSGGGLNTSTAAALQPRLSILWVSS